METKLVPISTNSSRKLSGASSGIEQVKTVRDNLQTTVTPYMWHVQGQPFVVSLQ